MFISNTPAFLSSILCVTLSKTKKGSKEYPLYPKGSNSNKSQIDSLYDVKECGEIDV